MQLSAANLILASQQSARATAPTPPDAQANFATALTRTGNVEAAAFEPLEFKQPAPAKAVAPDTTPSGAGFGGTVRLGANIDIRV
jgi:hypothetical protein